MATDLPFYKTDSAASARRPRTNKRYLVVLAVLGMLFLLFLNGRMSSSSSPDTTKQSDLFPSPTTTYPISKPQQEEESDVFPPILEDISDESEESEIIDEIEEEPKLDNSNNNSNAASSPHSDRHNSLPHPLEEESDDNVVLNESGHYQYLVVIASEAGQMSRRNLIREKYFGLRDNLLPCMQYNTDTYYKFWIYGGAPKSDTPERRQYEAEKMEWNDIEELPRSVKFEQESVIEWAETTLASQGITYDYLIVQDIYTFIRLSAIKTELDTGVISENTNSPVTINQNAPTNLVWGIFSGHEIDKHAFIIGSAAAKVALEKSADIHKHNASGAHLLTNMYNYFNSIASSVEHAIDESLEPEEAVEVQEQELPMFIREDGPEDTHRFIRWENNVESVHAEDSVVTHVYQDAEFAELARWTYLKPVMVCHTRKSAFKAGQPPVNPLDDDEETSDLIDPEQANSTLPESKLNANGPSIALMTSSYIYDYCMEPSATRAAANKRKFALRHGHSFVARSAEFAQQRGRKTVWGKIDAVEKVLPKYDWIFWMDMDAVIMNQEKSLFELLDNIRNRFPGGTESFDLNVDLIASRPTRDPMVNAGVFFLRNTPWSMQFLRDLQGVTEWYNKGSAYEQGAMWDLMQLPENQDHVFLLDRDDHTFNTFPRYYKPGDFIVHFAPDKCPNAATLKGLDAADRIEQGEVITSLDEE